jgi:acyl-CoA reductase-like NAD-dependent aldehyde dehydrogenase
MLLVQMLAKLLVDSGLPPGVLNIIHGAHVRWVVIAGLHGCVFTVVRSRIA